MRNSSSLPNFCSLSCVLRTLQKTHYTFNFSNASLNEMFSFSANAFASLNTSRLSSSAFANFSTSSFFSVCFCFVAVSPKVIWFGKDSIKDLKSVMTAESSPNFLTLSNSCKTERIMFLFAGINLPVSICLSINYQTLSFLWQF